MHSESDLEKRVVTTGHSYIEATSDEIDGVRRRFIIELRHGGAHLILNSRPGSSTDCQLLQIKIRPLQRIIIVRQMDGVKEYPSDYNESTFDHPVNTFQVTLDHVNRQARFGPSDNIRVRDEDMRSAGIGSYCLSRLIELAQKSCGDYSSKNGTLSSVDIKSDLDKYRRNGVYYVNGFIINGEINGEFTFNTINDLTPHWNHNKVIEIIESEVRNRYGIVL